MALEAQALREQADELTGAVFAAFPAMRASANVTQSSFAALAGVSQPYVSHVENVGATTSVALHFAQTLHSYSTRAARDLADARKEP